MATKKTSLSKKGKSAVKAAKHGHRVVPILSDSKRPALKWGKDSKPMTPTKVKQHWSKYPEHDVAIVVGDTLLVLDADTSEGVAALYMFEQSFDLKPVLTVSTARGEHHYFVREQDAFVKSDAPDKREHPERVDIKTGEALVIIPPSTGKKYLEGDIKSLDSGDPVPQAFIDAICRHNGHTPPRPPEPKQEIGPPEITTDTEILLSGLLATIDPDLGYDDWLRIAVAIYHATGGSDWGLSLFDSWSSKGSKYAGSDEIRKKWESFAGYTGKPITIATLYKYAREAGADIEAIELQVAMSLLSDTSIDNEKIHELLAFSLNGMSAEFELEMLDHVLILGRIAILGQWTVIYAQPNTGKTLLVIALLIEAIRDERIDPDRVFYINADDSHAGLTTKLKIAEAHGFHVLTPGYLGFKRELLLQIFKSMSASGSARGTIVIIDTLKKFTDLMNKPEASVLGVIIREFIGRGGTVIALAHVNKRRADDGKPIYAGTSDVVDDADCVYLLDEVDNSNDLRVVAFENIKNRGSVANTATYQYSSRTDIGYTVLLESVIELDQEKANRLREENDPAQRLIGVIEETIVSGTNSKTRIVEHVMASTDYSKRQILASLDQLTGDVAGTHRWRTTKGDRGKIIYSLLTKSSSDSSQE